ncbi:MAG: hypothetical protein EBZ48_03305 [Proteobacteria bacterium]|nr:hypothetical protein [Pseudomonadota bacterium]
MMTKWLRESVGFLVVVLGFMTPVSVSAGTLTVSLVRKDTLAPVVIPAGKSVDVSCATAEQEHPITIASGASSGSVTVANGQVVSCFLSSEGNTWLPVALGVYQGVGPASITMPEDGGAASLTLQMEPTSGNITVNLRNIATQEPILITALNNERVECQTSGGGTNAVFTAVFQASTSSVVLPAFKGRIYRCRVRGLLNFYTYNNFTVALPSSGQREITVELEPISSTVTFQFRDQNGSPFMPPLQEGSKMIECYSASGSPRLFLPVQFQLDGSTSEVALSAADGRSYRCTADIAPYAVLPFEFNIPVGQSSLVPVTLIPRTVTATVNFRYNDTPFVIPAGVSPSIVCEVPDSEPDFSSTASAAAEQTSTTISLFADQQYSCMVTNIPGYYRATPIILNAPNGSAPVANIDLAQMQANLQVNLKTLDGESFQAPTSWSVTCNTDISGSTPRRWYPGTIAAGESFTTIQAAGDAQVTCSVNPVGQYIVKSLPFQDVPLSGTTDFDIVVYPKDASMRVRLVAEANQVLSGLLNCTVTAAQTNYEFDSNFSTDVVNGEGIIQLPSGVELYPYVSCEGEGIQGFASSDDGSEYFQPEQDPGGASALAPSEQKTLDLVLRRPNATIEVILRDDSSTPVAGVSVQANSVGQNGASTYVIWTTTDADGKTRIPVIAGRTWTVQAGEVIDQVTGFTTLLRSKPQLDTFRIGLNNFRNSPIETFGATSVTLSATVAPGQSVVVQQLKNSNWVPVPDAQSMSVRAMTTGVSATTVQASSSFSIKAAGVYGIFVTGAPESTTLGKVRGLRARFVGGVAKVSWRSVSGATSYRVGVDRLSVGKIRRYRAVRPTQPYPNTRASIGRLRPGVYRFTARAVNSIAEGKASAVQATNSTRR